MDYTIYTKIRERDGSTREIMSFDLNFYCRCPGCGKEIEILPFIEVADNPRFNPYSSKVYCHNCKLFFYSLKEQINFILDDTDNMLVDKLHELSELIDEFKKKADEIVKK